MANEHSRRFEKSPFALAGIPPAQPTRNAFAEQGMSKINHHLRSNAFAAQSLNERTTSSPLDMHPAVRGRVSSESSLLPRLQAGNQRVVTPNLRDALELREAQSRSAAAEKDPRAAKLETTAAGHQAISGIAQTPSKKGVLELLTPVRNWRPFHRRSLKKDRTPRDGLAVSASSPAISSGISAEKNSMPPTPPAKNTPPAPVRADSASDATTIEGTIHVAYPLHKDDFVFDSTNSRRDGESDGLLPHFGSTRSRDQSAEHPDTTSPELYELLEPTVYSNPSAAPSPLRVNGESVGTSLSTQEVISSTTLLNTTPLLRHKSGCLQDIMVPRHCSTIFEGPPSVAAAAADAFADDETDTLRAFFEGSPVDADDEIMANILKGSSEHTSQTFDEDHHTVDVADNKLSDLISSTDGIGDQFTTSIQKVQARIAEIVADVPAHADFGAKIERVLAIAHEEISSKIEQVTTDMAARERATREELSTMATRKEVADKMDEVTMVTVNAVDHVFVGRVRDMEQKVEAYKRTVDQHCEEIVAYFNTVSNDMKVNNSAVSNLNNKIDNADAAALDGHVRIHDFQNKTNKLYSDVKQIFKDLKVVADRLTDVSRLQQEDSNKIKSEFADIKTAFQALKYEMNEYGTCRHAVARMYTRIATLTHMMDDTPIDEPIQGINQIRARCQQAVTTAETAHASSSKSVGKGKKPAHFEFVRGNDLDADATDLPYLPTRIFVSGKVVPTTPSAFLDMILSVQTRLNRIEEAQKAAAEANKKPAKK